MENFDLLSTVQPAEGWFAVFGIKGKWRTQELVATREEVDALTEKLVAQGRNVFYGVAKYTTGENRTKENVSALRAFWIDIDCGEDKAEVNEKTGRPAGYIDQKAGLTALKAFCKTVGLPKPILVNSGRGLHVYWALDRDISRGEWEPVAARLLHLCNIHNFYIDSSVFEVARILRIPGTLNFKEDPPAPVTVLSAAEPVDFEEFKEILGVFETPTKEVVAPKKERRESYLGKIFQDSIETSFAKILRRSQNGDGCNQILSCYEERADLAEPRWFDALSIAKFSRDKDTAIHTLSEGHPDYDPAAAEHKILHIKGPHTCAVFERNNPSGCDGCPYRGKITSPISLGKELKESKPPVQQASEDFEDFEEFEEYDEGEIADTEATEPEEVIVPKYPWPFYRGEGGGIWRRPIPKVNKKGETVEGDPIFVYPYDVYIAKRLRDPNEGGAVLIHICTPQDGILKCTVPNYKVTDRTELRKALSRSDVVCGEKQYALLLDMLIASFGEKQHARKADIMRTQFGWADNDSKFILGDKEITADGVFHSPPSFATTALADLMVPTGTMDKWSEVFNLYGREGLEPHAFAALTAFGAPLLKFLGQKGAILNVIHPSSGTGKTTILHMINSVWGSPDKLCLVQADTANAKIMSMGMRQHLPITVDEMTNTEAKDFSILIYAMSQGRGKDRMKASGNELRNNTTSWQTISVCSSNASFVDKLLGGFKNNPDGELMRLMEFKIDYSNAIDTATAKLMFDHQLLNNYGHAGPIYAEWLVKNKEEAENTCLSIQRKIDNELKLTQRERFWSAVLAANISGGLIAKQLGLIDWDMKRIYKWALSLIVELRKDVKPPAQGCVSVIGDFINRHMQNILVVNDQVDGRSNEKGFPSVEPKGELLIRYEPDTKFMFIAAKPFQKDCVLSQVNYKDTLRQLEDKGIYIETKPKRLTKGMKVVSTPVQSIKLDCSNAEFLSVDGLLQVEDEEEEAQDAGRGDQLPDQLAAV